eukprot:352868-Chlamydomonas_euryale.AAC.4
MPSLLKVDMEVRGNCKGARRQAGGGGGSLWRLDMQVQQMASGVKSDKEMHGKDGVRIWARPRQRLAMASMTSIGYG